MYQSLVGRPIYLAYTRPDIAYLVSVINQFMHDPREPHLQVAYKVFHYLKGNLGKGILVKKNDTLALEAYTDADYAGSIVAREPHLQAAYKVLHYLKGNLGKGILVKKNDTLALEAYTDADYAGSIVDQRSIIGYCTFLEDNLVTWRSKK